MLTNTDNRNIAKNKPERDILAEYLSDNPKSITVSFQANLHKWLQPFWQSVT